MKILTDSQHSALKQKADEYDKIVNAMISSSEGVDAAEVTSDVIIEAINSADHAGKTGEDQVETLKSQISTLTDGNNALAAEKETLVSEKETLTGDLAAANARIQALEKEIDGTAAEEAAAISSTGDSTEEQDIVKFAEKNLGNPIAVLDEMKKQGFKIK
ncbi:MAG: hypothetical protein AAGU18_10880 [Proteiniphilum sp.]